MCLCTAFGALFIVISVTDRATGKREGDEGRGRGKGKEEGGRAGGKGRRKGQEERAGGKSRRKEQEERAGGTGRPKAVQGMKEAEANQEGKLCVF